MRDAFDRYSPLTPDELAAGPAIARRTSDDGELVSPVPADAPPPPTQHFKHGEPAATWIYRDASGAECYRILRFDFRDRRKEFCPLTLWRNARGLRWRWKALCPPRPLICG
jgi:putative DNA primase/helicase